MTTRFSVGGHDAAVRGEGSIVIKKFQHRDRGRRELEFLKRAAEHPQLSGMVPAYRGCRMPEDSSEGQVPEWIEMENMLHGMTDPLVMDIKLGTITYGHDATEEKKQEQIGKAIGSTTHSLGIRIVGARMPREHPGADHEMIGSKYKRGEPTDEESFVPILGRFLASSDLRIMALLRLQEITQWFSEQTEFEFFASSLLFCYDAAAAPPRLAIKLIDFAHAYPIQPPAQHRDENVLTGLHTLLRCMWTLQQQQQQQHKESAIAPPLPMAEAGAAGAAMMDWEATARRLRELCIASSPGATPIVRSIVFVRHGQTDKPQV